MDYETNLENPINITIENNTNIDQAIRYYNVNFQEILKPGDKIIVTAFTSEALAYYTSIKSGFSEIKKELGPMDFLRLRFPSGELEIESISETEEYTNYTVIYNHIYQSMTIYKEPQIREDKDNFEYIAKIQSNERPTLVGYNSDGVSCVFEDESPR